jgi:ATP-dependent RNA circularization protein (DNA/RNA ligase family)
MSKLTEIQNQYQGYVAAAEAVRKTNPGTVRVNYTEDGSDGYFIYDPKENKIVVYYLYSSMTLDPKNIPDLIKALREFIE